MDLLTLIATFSAASSRNPTLQMSDLRVGKIHLVYWVRAGSFSLCWRLGNITQVSKSGSANSCLSDYCPVTITLVLSKFFEQLLTRHLSAFVERNNFFANLQSGFRKGLGAFNAILTSFFQRIVSLDFSAAIDCVGHKAPVFMFRQLHIGWPFFIS